GHARVELRERARRGRPDPGREGPGRRAGGGAPGRLRAGAGAREAGRRSRPAAPSREGLALVAARSAAARRGSVRAELGAARLDAGRLVLRARAAQRRRARLVLAGLGRMSASAWARGIGPALLAAWLLIDGWQLATRGRERLAGDRAIGERATA